MTTHPAHRLLGGHHLQFRPLANGLLQRWPPLLAQSVLQEIRWGRLPCDVDEIGDGAPGDPPSCERLASEMAPVVGAVSSSRDSVGRLPCDVDEIGDGAPGDPPSLFASLGLSHSPSDNEEDADVEVDAAWLVASPLRSARL